MKTNNLKVTNAVDRGAGEFFGDREKIQNKGTFY